MVIPATPAAPAARLFSSFAATRSACDLLIREEHQSKISASERASAVLAAHGGGVRALIALFGLMPRDEATHAQIAQGVVYVFADGTMARYA